MTVSIDGQIFEDLEGLSPRANTILGFVRNGEPWLQWAIHDTTQRYDFSGEEGLVQGIQSGLHSGETLLLPGLGLELSLRRLWQLSAETLQILETAEAKGGKPSVGTLKKLAVAELYTSEQLVNGQGILSAIGVEDAPVFQAMTLLDLLAIFDLDQRGISESTAAAEFAVDAALTPLEFVDFYKFYLSVADSLPQKSGSVSNRVDGARDLLTPHVWSMLRCPFAPEDLTCSEAGALVQTWLETGSPLGFQTVARGLKEISTFSDGEVTDEAKAQEASEAYMKKSRSLLSQHEPYREELTQDGSIQLFQIDGDGASAVLARNRLQGTLTITSLKTH